MIIAIFIAIYYIIIACGKHILRFSACVGLILLHLSMGGLAICLGTTYGIIVAVFSFIRNTIGILISLSFLDFSTFSFPFFPDVINNV